MTTEFRGESGRGIVFAGLASLLLAVAGCGGDGKSGLKSPKSNESESDRKPDIAALRPRVKKFCGDCHAVPDPATFPRKAWYAEVEQGYRFYEESARTDLKPPPMNDIVAYYRHLAPENLTAAKSPVATTPSHVVFTPAIVPFESQADSGAVSCIRVLGNAGSAKEFAFCDMRTGDVARVANGPVSHTVSRIGRMSHPAHVEPCDLNRDGIGDFIAAELGSYLPADHDKGAIVWFRGRKDGSFDRIVLKEKLGRVADVQVADFDGDKSPDLVVAEFGWRTTGRILLLRQTRIADGVPAFETVVLDKRHGAIHVPVVDLNRDGRPDFIALISQEHEAVEAFLNIGNGRFERKPIFAAGDPSFGSSGIQLVDLDRDGDVDVLYTNGDSFDSFYLKPYHAVHWLENRGTFPFRHHELTRMPGVTRAVAADLDGDGDFDVAAAAYLPQQTLNAAGLDTFDCLIWLEQTRPGVFVRRTIEQSAPGHMALDVGDFDGDGRADLTVGHHDRKRWLTIWRNQPANKTTTGGKPAAAN